MIDGACKIGMKKATKKDGKKSDKGKDKETPKVVSKEAFLDILGKSNNK